MVNLLYSHLLLAPWRSFTMTNHALGVVRARTDVRSFVCGGCSNGAHDTLRTCPICGLTPVTKRLMRDDARYDDTVCVRNGMPGYGWLVEGDGLFRRIFPTVRIFPTAFEAMHFADNRLRANDVALQDLSNV